MRLGRPSLLFLPFRQLSLIPAALEHVGPLQLELFGAIHASATPGLVMHGLGPFIDRPSVTKKKHDQSFASRTTRRAGWTIRAWTTEPLHIISQLLLYGTNQLTVHKYGKSMTRIWDHMGI